MTPEDDSLSDKSLRALALHIAQLIIDAALSKHDVKLAYEISADNKRLLVDGYYKLLSKAHQDMIGSGLAPEKLVERLTHLGKQIIDQQIPVAERALARDMAMSDAARNQKH